MPDLDNGIDLAVQLLVIGLLVAFLVPVAISEIVDANTTGWGTAETSLWDLLPLFLVFAAVLYVIGMAVQAYRD